ncbi:MAG: ribonuclease P protein component [Planctomycetota bacterium]
MTEKPSREAVSGLDPEAEKTVARQTLTRAMSLRRRGDYARVYAQGKRVRGRLILVVAAPGLNPLSPRMGLSVGRKFNKSAVLRNQARRVLRAAFRLQKAQLPLFDMILIPVAPGKEYRTQEVEAELRRLCRKLERRWQEDAEQAAAKERS